MLITHKHLEESIEYDGSQIEASWAFKSFGIKGSSIITWIGSMNITPDNLKDFEDVGLEIKSDKIINIIVEHFDEQPANLRIAYMRQRLLVVILKDMLSKMGIESIRKGDDIYIVSKAKPKSKSKSKSSNRLSKTIYKKLTVSIATISQSSMKIHLGINLTSEGTPEDVETIGILELFEDINLNNIKLDNTNINKTNLNYISLDNANMNDINLIDFINNIVKNYMDELNDIELDISKTNLL
ncbi:hypothetical protein MBBAR_21c00380 [Methanobrevibacter arboriphilus JCM 13429 = DSM 1125]|uniref:Uncharacterized protein n=1 Tax=Methanobrevibacter arboriphilus JCM 13429 = DSM 1125 TaxID=1300164 RepID=A0A1V6N0V4_METAZ|nr:DUF366 family protein [Methanobrevibacter arboriphilus]OQD58319.1 hypothetical protein MBBAR_21c00380 [Methanobrevibacter arboriphilus JCM 13429 = DSM 1125]